MISIFNKPPKKTDSPDEYRGQEDHISNKPSSSQYFGANQYDQQASIPAPRPTSNIMRPSASTTTNNSGITLISKGLIFNGEIKGNGSVRIEGSFSGTLDIDDEVIIGEEGRVEGNIKSKIVSVLGHLKGNITAAEKINIDTSGSIVGDIMAPRVVMAEGAVYKGRIDMDSKTTGAKHPEPSRNPTGDDNPVFSTPASSNPISPPGPPPPKSK